MHVILHVGLPKTGSSALQEYLYSVRAQLPSAGYHYPDLDHRDHWKLAVALAPERSRKGPPGYLDRRASRMEDTRESVLARVADVLRAAGPDEAVFISHENFSTPGQREAVQRFIKDIVPDAELHVLAYVRDPVSFYPSGVQQVLKNRKPIGGPSKAVSKQAKRAAALLDTFGDALTLRAYRRDLLVRGDVIEDLREFVRVITGREMPVAPAPISTNTSLTGAACALLLLYDRHLGSGGNARYSSLRAALTKFDQTRSDPRLRLPEGWKEIIATRNHRACNAIVDRLAYDSTILESLRLKPSPGRTEKLGPEAAAQWINTYLTPEYIRDLIEHLRGREGKPPSEQLLTWLERQGANRSDAPVALSGGD